MNEWLSLLSFYLYDNTLFDNIELPSEVDRETLINNLLLECSELEVIYSDYDFLKQALTFWSKSRIHAWEKIAQAVYTNYDPFISMERYEKRVITGNTNTDRSLKGANAIDNNATGASTNLTNAFDSGTGTERETVQDRTNSHTDGTNSENENVKGSHDTTDNFTSKGDSALYTKQAILEQEINIRDKFNIYDYIVNDFKKKFCILVY